VENITTGVDGLFEGSVEKRNMKYDSSFFEQDEKMLKTILAPPGD